MILGFALPVVVLLAAWPSPALAESPGSAKPSRPSPSYTHREEAPYLVLSWNCVRSGPGSLLIEGRADVPVRAESPIRGGQLRLLGVDEKGRPVSEAVGYLPPVLSLYESAPFAVELSLAGNEARVDLYYSFDYFDRNGDRKRRSSRNPLIRTASRQSFHWRVPAACPLP